MDDAIVEVEGLVAKPAKYALEMNAGWFKSRSIRPGAVIAGIDKAPAAR